MLKRIVRIVLALMILGGAVGLAAWMINGEPAPEEDAAPAPAPEVSALSVDPGRYRPQMEWSGQVVARQRVEVATPLATEVLTVPVAEGDRIGSGAALVELDTREVEWDLAQARSELRELELARQQTLGQQETDEALLALERELLAQAERALERERGLRGRGASTEAALEEAESRVLQARQALRQRESALAQYPVELERQELQAERASIGLERLERLQQRAAMAAPFAGVVEAVNVSAGQYVNAGQALVSLYAEDSLVWRVAAPDRQSGALQARLNGQWIDLTRRAPRVAEGSASRHVEFQLPADVEWAPGEIRSARVQRAALDQVQPVPASSLYSGNRVFIINDSDELESVVVQPLGTTWLDGEEYWLLSAGDLPPAGRILATRLPNALNGQAVNVSELRTLANGQE